MSIVVEYDTGIVAAKPARPCRQISGNRLSFEGGPSSHRFRPAKFASDTMLCSPSRYPRTAPNETRSVPDPSGYSNPDVTRYRWAAMSRSASSATSIAARARSSFEASSRTIFGAAAVPGYSLPSVTSRNAQLGTITGRRRRFERAARRHREAESAAQALRLRHAAGRRI